MNVFEAICSRRSIRKWRNEVPREEAIRKCIEAALFAPSAHNSQPWKYLIVRNRDLIKKLSETQFYTKFLENAPIAIVCLADEKRSPGHWVEDVSLSVMLLMLEAHELGLGTCWGAVYQPGSQTREDYVRNLLNISSEYRVLCILGIGYPDETPSPKKIKTFSEATESIE